MSVLAPLHTDIVLPPLRGLRMGCSLLGQDIEITEKFRHWKVALRLADSISDVDAGSRPM